MIPPNIAKSHFLSLMNTNWTVLKCLNRCKTKDKVLPTQEVRISIQRCHLVEGLNGVVAFTVNG